MPMKDDQYTPIPSPSQMEEMEALQHKVQSAVAFLMNHAQLNGIRHTSTEPKFLRVGINSALIETSALARLMLSKKIITNDEYFEMIIQVWREEVERYLVDLHKINPLISL